MKRDERFIRLAIKVAEKSSHRFKMGAIITNGSRIISFGINKYKTHPQQINWHTNTNSLSIHAELDAIIPYNRGTAIYVARILKNGKIGLARPCKICQNIIVSVGIKKIIYTINDNSFEYINFL